MPYNSLYLPIAMLFLLLPVGCSNAVGSEPKPPAAETPDTLYNNGLKMFKDLKDESTLKKGFALFQRAAKGGHTDALNALGLAQIFGFGTEMDMGGGRDNLVKAAEAGSFKALGNVTTLILMHIVLKDDSKKALSYIERAAAKGDVESQYRLGRLLFDPGVLYEPDTAAQWFKKAAGQGHETSAAFVAGLSLTKQIKNANEQAALTILKHLSAQGNATANYWLGEYFAELDTVHADPTLALDYFIQADELGIHSTTYAKAIRLVNGMVRGKASKEQVLKASALLEKKATNSCLANALLGAIYVIEESHYQDHAKGKLIMEKGAKMGCEISAIALGDMYRLGDGTTNGLVKAVEYYALAGPKSGEALYKAAGTLLSRTTREMTSERKIGYQWALEAAKLGSPQACSMLASILHKGGYEKKDEAVKAYAWALVAIETDPEYRKADLLTLEEALTEEQQLEGVKVSQYFKITIQARALQGGGDAFRF
jgi:TPR repeat protein